MHTFIKMPSPVQEESLSRAKNSDIEHEDKSIIYASTSNSNGTAPLLACSHTNDVHY